MVHRQHRVPSHSSSESAHSQLSPRALPQGGTGVSERSARDPVLQLQITHLPPLGRTTAQIGRVWPPASRPPATARGSRVTGSEASCAFLTSESSEHPRRAIFAREQLGGCVVAKDAFVRRVPLHLAVHAHCDQTKA